MRATLQVQGEDSLESAEAPDFQARLHQVDTLKKTWLFKLLTGDLCFAAITAEKTWAGQTSFGLT